MTSAVAYLGRVVSSVGTFYQEINPATLSGAIDVIVVRRASGELACTPFHVRFGKLKLLRPTEKIVTVTVNGEPTDLPMKVGDAGEAYFVVETTACVPPEYATSPIARPSSPASSTGLPAGALGSPHRSSAHRIEALDLGAPAADPTKDYESAQGSEFDEQDGHDGQAAPAGAAADGAAAADRPPSSGEAGRPPPTPSVAVSAATSPATPTASDAERTRVPHVDDITQDTSGELVTGIAGLVATPHETAAGPGSARSDRSGRSPRLDATPASTSAHAPLSPCPDELAPSPMRRARLTRRDLSAATATAAAAAAAPHRHHHYAKSLRLTSEQLEDLNLQPGVNTVTFTVNGGMQGKAVCQSRIFLWKWDAKIVVSDVDGTITKSDALGHILFMVGRDWTHEGIARLYQSISNNGYHFMYLTSRAIGQATSTREYLKNIDQSGIRLPVGPVIMSPDRLLKSLHREVILRKPEEFKIAALRDIRRCFGTIPIDLAERDAQSACSTTVTPFYAGFGNRITDALSYRSVDIPSTRIFTINSTGEIQLELLLHYRSSYFKLNDLVDHMFPPVKTENPVVIDPSFNDFNFWRNPL
ncbi:hypothetical protein CXG81DRAFT_14294, partial [Caulochytrium protostelioides]